MIEAFDQLHAAYRVTYLRLDELRGHAELFDIDRQILQSNLYGVDLNEEAIQICRLSLWIKTAQRGKKLTSLDHTIRVGNSVVADPSVHPLAFDWQREFPEVFQRSHHAPRDEPNAPSTQLPAESLAHPTSIDVRLVTRSVTATLGGFDVVVGNPPYVRQEWLTPFKTHFEQNYRAYHGMADLYVYFFERGLELLKPGGRLSFVVTNKWMKAGYGEPLRRLLADASWIDSVVDFGHAKQIFEDADVFPSIFVVRRPTDVPKPATVRLCSIPREQLRVDDLSRQIADEGVELPVSQLGSDVWQLEPTGVNELLAKIKERGTPLSKFAGVKPLVGIKTGFNDAFFIDQKTKDSLVSHHASSVELLRPYLRGQDYSRWYPDWEGYWMIALASSENREWPWGDAGDDAEAIFRKTYPAIFDHLAQYRDQLQARQDQGRYWWELRSCAYWKAFDGPKLMYPEITWRAEWCFDDAGTLTNNTAYILPCDDLWILAVANAPISWWYSWRTAIHGKDEALRFIKDFVQDLPIPNPSDSQRQTASKLVSRLNEIAKSIRSTGRTLLDWLKVEFAIEKPSQKLQAALTLDSDGLVAEVKKLRGKKQPLSSSGLKALRDEFERSIVPAQRLTAEAATLERQVSDLVNAAYGLTPAEVELMWQTAPPRMPIPKP